MLPPQAAEAAELAKFEAARQRALEQKAVQTQQLEELKKRILAERAEAKREGELLRQQALEEAEEMKAKEALRLARAKQLNADTKEANRTLQAFKLRVRGPPRDVCAAATSRAPARALHRRANACVRPRRACRRRSWNASSRSPLRRTRARSPSWRRSASAVRRSARPRRTPSARPSPTPWSGALWT